MASDKLMNYLKAVDKKAQIAWAVIKKSVP